MSTTTTSMHTIPGHAITIGAMGCPGGIATEAHSAQDQPASNVRRYTVPSAAARYDKPIQTLLDRLDDLFDEVDSLGGVWSRPLSLKIDAIEVQLAALGYSTTLGLIPGSEDDR